MNVLEINKSSAVWKERKEHRVVEQLFDSFFFSSECKYFVCSIDIGIVTCVFVKKKKRGVSNCFFHIKNARQGFTACVRESTSKCVREREYAGTRERYV